MKRRPDWPERLTACVDAARLKTFRWAEHDCCTFAADCILAMTGEDIAAGARGGYRDRLAATRVLVHRFGVTTLEGLGDRLLGRPINPKLAQRGDAALVKVDGRDSIGIVLGALVAAPGYEGLMFVPIGRAQRAWRVAR